MIGGGVTNRMTASAPWKIGLLSRTAVRNASETEPGHAGVGVGQPCRGRRHDAAHTIATFSTWLRDQVDLDTLTGELLAVVDQTMQPTRASLWLRHETLNPTGGAAGRQLDR
jgi:hypothetical protein